MTLEFDKFVYKQTGYDPELLYLDWFNNFLTVQAFASHHGLCTSFALIIIERGRQLNHAKN